MSDDLELTIDDLRMTVKRQIEASQNLEGSIRALTEMMGHLIDSNKELSEKLDKLSK